MNRSLVGSAISLVSLMAATAALGATGIVFEDLNANGVHDEGEPGIGGIFVQAGGTVTKSDELGRYVLEATAQVEQRATGPNKSSFSPFIVLTRPRGYDCDVWYRRGPGDFALRRRTELGSDFVFVHMSDAHTTDVPGDLSKYGIPGPVASMPNWLSGMAMWGVFRMQNPGLDKEVAVEALRKKLAKYHDVSEMGEIRLMGTLVGDIVDEPDRTVDPAAEFRAATQELRALAPAFVLSTGDLVVESNAGDAESIERWMKFYATETRATGLTFYDTIGNNELAGSENGDFNFDDPGYGKGLFRERFGPTFYSFDRGGFHFIALDTHFHVDPLDDSWNSQEMEREVRLWLLADLDAHRDRKIVILNHEPFRGDPEWSIPSSYIPEAAGQEWLETFDVPYTFSGHLHINGTTSEGKTQHVMTGALSGARWTMPPEVYPRGYRLVQAHDGELFTAWKKLGQPLLGFVTPTDSSLFATAPLGSAPNLVVVVAADTDGPLAEVSLAVNGAAVELERWSEYFFAALIVGPASDSFLELSGVSRNGRMRKRTLGTPPAGAAAN